MPPAATLQTQLLMDYRLPAGKSHLSVKEVGAACGYHSRTLLDAYEAGKLMGFALNGGGQDERFSPRIPRENAALLLCKIANYDAEGVERAILDAALKLPRPHLERLIAQLVQMRARR